MTAYYNEFDPRAAEWLRVLILEGVIAPGDVDERSIEDVTSSDLKGYTQCHFFAGIGGWSYALRLAGWPDDRAVWTGSCPCQPFSAAGKGKGFADERHLWPAWLWLLRQCRPDRVFGEQVARKAGDKWWDVVSTDLEGEGYTSGSVVLGAHSVGAPHIRLRRYWVGHSGGGGSRRNTRTIPGAEGIVDGRLRRLANLFGPTSAAGILADRRRPRLEIIGEQQARRQREAVERGGEAGALAHHHHLGRIEYEERDSEPPAGSEEGACWDDTGGRGGSGRLADSDGRDAGAEWIQRSGQHGQQQQEDCGVGFWDQCVWLPCRDGKARPVEPGTFPLAHGVPGRVGLLRGYGNAIVPEVAAAFIEASMI